MPVILKRGDDNRWLSGDVPTSDEMKKIKYSIFLRINTATSR